MVLLRIALEEIFGTVVSVIPCVDLEWAMEIGTGHRKAGIERFSGWCIAHYGCSLPGSAAILAAQ